MIEGQASRTAERVAQRRAVHQVLDDPPVFVDPLALQVIDCHVAERIRANPQEFNDSRLAPYLRAAFAVRSRFAEDELADAVKRGITQYAILGAGFDTFAYRNPFLDLRVFEVDYPATQQLKRRRIAEAGIHIPHSVTYVEVDFAAQSFLDRLVQSGFVRGRPAFFSWLGVVPYLEVSAITQTLQTIAGLPRETTIVFDFGCPRSSLSPIGKVVFDRMSVRVAAAGEPWKALFSPEELLRLLHLLGFSVAEDCAAQELNAKYFSARSDGLCVGEMAHVAKAIV